MNQNHRLVCRHHADQMLNAVNETEPVHAIVMLALKEIHTIKSVDAVVSAKSTMTVIIDWLVLDLNASIRASAFAEHLHNVMLRDMCQLVRVRQAILAIHCSNVVSCRQHCHHVTTFIHAILRRVDRTATVEITMVRQCVHVCQITLDHRQVVDQNVWSIPNVRPTVHASIKNVLIHVRTRAESVQFAIRIIIRRFVHVQMASKETHLCNAREFVSINFDRKAERKNILICCNFLSYNSNLS